MVCPGSPRVGSKGGAREKEREPASAQGGQVTSVHNMFPKCPLGERAGDGGDQHSVRESHSSGTMVFLLLCGQVSGFGDDVVGWQCQWAFSRDGLSW